MPAIKIKPNRNGRALVARKKTTTQSIEADLLTLEGNATLVDIRQILRRVVERQRVLLNQ